MNAQSEVAAETGVEHFDVLIVGAGVSGVTAAWHLKERLPGKRFAIIEKQATLGGTWATHRFPGIRSDSDLYTFGFGWKPWMGKMFATGAEIVSYLEEAVEEEGLTPHIRYGVALIAADWSETERRWTLTVEEGGARRRMTATLCVCARPTLRNRRVSDRSCRFRRSLRPRRRQGERED